jgi:hypothetical protein
MKLISQLKKLICSHKFNLQDLQERDNNGNVTWSCFKCGKVFVAECGLDVLKNGKCIVNNETYGGTQC